MGFHQAVFAFDTEDDNDSPAGASVLIAPDHLFGYSITSGDDDWFQIAKGKCNRITVTFLPDGGVNDFYSFELYDPRMNPPTLITAKSGNGMEGIELSAFIPHPSVFARVHGSDLTDTVSYDMLLRTESVNPPIQKEIGPLARRLKLMKSRLASLKRNDGDSALVKRRQDDIRDLRKRINMLKMRLCR